MTDDVKQTFSLSQRDHLDDLVVGLKSGRSRIVTRYSRLNCVIDLVTGPQWLICQVPGFNGSALGLVGLVSVHCEWVRYQACEVLFQHSNTFNFLDNCFSEICLRCLLDVERPRKQTNHCHLLSRARVACTRSLSPDGPPQKV